MIIDPYKYAAPGEVTFDANSAGAQSPGNSATWTIAHTTGGSDRYLLLTVMGERAPASAPTYNGVSMTQIATIPLTLVATTVRMYGLVAPASGANNIVIDTSNGGGAYFAALGASFSGVSQSAPIGTAVTNFVDAQTQNYGTAQLTSLTAGQAAYAAIMAYNKTVTTPSLTLIQAYNPAGEYAGGHGYLVMGGSGNEDCQFDWTGNQFWGEISVPLLPA